MFNTGQIIPKSELLHADQLASGARRPYFYGDLFFDWYKRAYGTQVIQERVAGDVAEAVGGTVASLDGSNNLHKHTNLFNPVGMQQWSIVIDVKNYQFDGRIYSFDKYGIFIQNSGTTSFSIIVNDSASAYILKESITLPSGTGVITLTRDKGNGFKVYVDKTKTTYTDNGNDVLDVTYQMLGARYNGVIGGTIESYGTFDSEFFAVYENKVLSDSEVADIVDNKIFPDGASQFMYLNNGVDSVDKDTWTEDGTVFDDVTSYTPLSTKTALDKGYYLLSGGEKVVNPQYTKPAGATEYQGQKLHNLIDSYITLNPTGSTDAKFDCVDRANTTYFTDTCRASSYYDSADRVSRSRFHISELDFDTLQTYLQDTYKQTFFVVVSPTACNTQYIFEIFIYQTQKTGDDLIKVLNYSNYFCTGYTYMTDDNSALMLDDNGIPMKTLNP